MSATAFLAVGAAAASAHEVHDHGEPDPYAQYLLDAAEDAPPAVDDGTRCARTMDVEGQGPSCIREDGLWTMPTPLGTDRVVHGADGDIPLEEMDPPVEARVVGASAADVHCAQGAHAPRYVVIYARPRGFPDRSGDVVPFLKREVYRASAFMDAHAKQDDANATAKIRVECDPDGAVRVHTVELQHGPAGDDFYSIYGDLYRLGFVDEDWAPTARRVLVYYDDHVTSPWTFNLPPDDPGPAGEGHAVSTPVGIPIFRTVDSQANVAGSMAVQYATWDGIPLYEVLLHEMLHNMGAVADDAPESSGAGHCNTTMDVMCYADAGPHGRPSDIVYRCPTFQLDCGRNTYFSAAAAPSGYLATHWNVASPLNRYVYHGIADRDVTRPQTVEDQTYTATPTDVEVTWSNGTIDDVGVTGYVIQEYHSGYGPIESLWHDLVRLPATATSYTLRGRRPQSAAHITVRAVDAAGNLSDLHESDYHFVTQPDDEIAPVIPPAAPIVTARSETSVTLSWGQATDNVEVRGYTMWTRAPDIYGDFDANIWNVQGVASTTAEVPLDRSARDGRPLRMWITAYDVYNNHSAPTEAVVAATLLDATPPTPVASVRAAPSSFNPYAVTLDWDYAYDDTSEVDYIVERLQPDGTWSEISRSPNVDAWVYAQGVAEPQVLILPASSLVTLRVVSIDMRGNRAEPSPPVTFTTPPAVAAPSCRTLVLGTWYECGTQPIVDPLRSIREDRRAPTRPPQLRFTKRTSAAAALTWGASSDDRGLAHYALSGCAGTKFTRQVPARTRTVTVKGKPRQWLCVQVRAVDTAGNRSAPATARIALKAAPKRAS